MSAPHRSGDGRLHELDAAAACLSIPARRTPFPTQASGSLHYVGWTVRAGPAREQTRGTPSTSPVQRTAHEVVVEGDASGGDAVIAVGGVVVVAVLAVATGMDNEPGTPVPAPSRDAVVSAQVAPPCAAPSLTLDDPVHPTACRPALAARARALELDPLR